MTRTTKHTPGVWMTGAVSLLSAIFAHACALAPEGTNETGLAADSVVADGSWGCSRGGAGQCLGTCPEGQACIWTNSYTLGPRARRDGGAAGRSSSHDPWDHTPPEPGCRCVSIRLPIHAGDDEEPPPPAATPDRLIGVQSTDTSAEADANWGCSRGGAGQCLGDCPEGRQCHWHNGGWYLGHQMPAGCRCIPSFDPGP